MASSTMHAPLQYAADKLLRNRPPFTDTGLTGFLENHNRLESSAQVVAVNLADLTDGVIIVDRRTVSRWLEAAR